ncbi:hypothetical protein HW571_25070 [Agrobacterium genomosp. 3]|uniref:hypothetical protein n=1 Tax=Agrobacterium tomkonis TaxID=1183410 RepID=UPI001CD85CC5|nr:hypothetical protein [Agrobacterium tomkonis]MCA1879329.1 hypothetical protein [Agrobacterium tumefaciens]MCA1894492.1 hypothetical protein [Agrobacterium tomkonis]
MKKAINLPAKADEANTAAPAGGPVAYRIKPGVPWINGKRTGGAATINLEPHEAAYDLGLGRISPADQPWPEDWPAPDIAAGDADGRD